jgi:hypothetical protein
MSSKTTVFRFGLKALLIAFTALAVWLGWVSRNARQQANAVAEITKLGGEVQYNAPLVGIRSTLGDLIGPDYFQTAVVVSADGEQFDDSIMESVATLNDAASVSLTNAEITDSGLERIVPLTDLKHLNLMHTHVTDKCIPWLSAMEGLRFVELRGTGVTTKGAESLQALRPDLEVRHHFLERAKN